jgi:hypothetical protein
MKPPTLLRLLPLLAPVLLAGCAYQKRLEMGDALLARGDYDQALQSFREARDYPLKFSSEQARDKIEQTKGQWAASLDRQARALELEGHPGAAWVLALKAAELDPLVANRQRPDRLRAELLAMGDYPIRADAADARAGQALDRLGDGIGGRTTLRLTSAPGDPAKAVLHLAIDEPRYAENSHERAMSATYQVGTRLVPNPQFQARQADIDAARRALDVARHEEGRRFHELQEREQELDRFRAQWERDRRRGGDRDRRRDNDRDRDHDRDGDRRREDEWLGRLRNLEHNRDHARNLWQQAQQYTSHRDSDLHNAFRALETTPQMVEEPILAVHHFPATVRVLTADATLHGEIEHGDGRPAVRIEEPLHEDISAVSHPAQPIASVAERRERLPERPSLIGPMTGDAARHARRAIDESFRRFRERILHTANMAAGDAEQLDHLAVYWLSDPGRVDSELRKRIDRLGQALGGFPDASKLIAAN